MDQRKLSRRQLLKAAGLLGAAAVVLDPTQVFAEDDDGEGRVTWDIVNINFTSASGPHVTRNGNAHAWSTDNSPTPKQTGRIEVTGHGTFPNTDKCSKDVTGGGTWKITDTSDDPKCFKGSGNYRVTELLSWHRASGTLPLPDATMDKGTPSAGLALLRVVFTDSTTSKHHPGTLTVSCHLPVGSPTCMFEGITASVAYEDFWQNESPKPGVEGNRTLFHVSSNGEGE